MSDNLHPFSNEPMNEQTYADIIMPVPLRRLFTYEVPAEMQSTIAIGSRVLVQFGAKKFYSGIVANIHHTRPINYDTKPISQVVDSTPIILPLQLKLWQWISDYYICAMGDVYRAALPSGLKLESESRLISNPEFVADTLFDEKTEKVLNFVEAQKSCTIAELSQHCAPHNPLPQLRTLIEQNAIFISEQLRDAYKPKKEPFYSINEKLSTEEGLCIIMDKLEKAPRQLESFMLLMQKLGGAYGVAKHNKVGRSELVTDSRISIPALKAIAERGFINIEQLAISRLKNDFDECEPPHALNQAQQKALDDIHEAWQTKQVSLLHGVTSSGKTEIYIHTINEMLRQGKQVLYLLPEIALTAQITNRLRRHFGNLMGIYHSKFSDAERVEVWNKQLSSEPYQLIVGVRSSVMLPFHSLGLIIVDEEHEQSYKQQAPAPRYHARDVATVLAGYFDAKVLLGSATPSMESYMNAQQGKYGYASLTTRYADIELPEIIPVDMREENAHKTSTGMFSSKLKDAIDEAIKNGEQVILFQNRRGYSPYIECNDCSWIPKCNNCDVSLTYHKITSQLICHYCSYTMGVPKICPVCGQPHLSPHGFGTEKIEEQVKDVFPQARVVRMDRDTANGRKALEQIIADFEMHKYDILIGTQMISKGLDFEKVSIVGIMNADATMNMPDFRAIERSYQLIAQVSGRAGRHGKRGRVYIQTRSIDSPLIANIVKGDFKANLMWQAAERQQYHYPPFYRLIYLTVKHRTEYISRNAAQALAADLRATFGERIIGPQAPMINRIDTYFQQRIMVKMERSASPATIKNIVMDKVNNLLGDQQWRSVQVEIDVDPN